MRQESFPCDGSTLALPAVEPLRWIVNGRSLGDHLPEWTPGARAPTAPGRIFLGSGKVLTRKGDCSCCARARTRKKKMRRTDYGAPAPGKKRQPSPPHDRRVLSGKKETEKESNRKARRPQENGGEKRVPANVTKMFVNKRHFAIQEK
nr:hypothetical protein [Pandoravirus aubagnensis]